MIERRTISLDERDIVLYTSGTREALHAAIKNLYEVAKARTAGAPDRVDPDTGEVLERVWRLTFGEDEDDRTLRQNAFYWAAVLPQIAAQGRQDGRVWDQEEWHNLFKRSLLGYEIVREKVAGRKRKTTYRRLRSTTRLTVKQMSAYLDEVIALATTELGVEFVFDHQEREAVRYRAPARKSAKKEPQAA
jgi:hypothetical protein